MAMPKESGERGDGVRLSRWGLQKELRRGWEDANMEWQRSWLEGARLQGGGVGFYESGNSSTS